MSNHEDEERAQGLAQFHDKHSYQKLPDWLTSETEAKDAGSKTATYHVGKHVVELTAQGTLIIHEAYQCLFDQKIRCAIELRLSLPLLFFSACPVGIF